MPQISQYDIILIVPHYGAQDGFIWKAIEYRFQSPGVLSIATYLNSKGYKTTIFDCNLEQIFEKDFDAEFYKRYGKDSFKFIGFSAATQTINAAYRLAEKLKIKYPETVLIFGGAHPTALPEDVLKNAFADIVVIGEGELTSELIISNVSKSEIDGIAYKENDEIITNAPAKRIKNLDDLPINDYNLIPLKLCKPLIGSYEKLPATIMVTARGCPGRCTFCSRVVGNQLSELSPQRIFEEINILYHNFGIRQIIFYDDTFISNRKRIEDFCDLLIASDIKISWTCSSRVDRVYPDLLSKMKMAGCHQIMYGIESFNEQVLRNLNKKTKPEEIYFAIEETKKAGIEARAAIMIGSPGDTKEILNDNIRHLNKLNPDLIQATITTAIPGSLLFSEADKNNKILTYNWDDYEGNKQITEHESLDFKTLQKFYRKTYLRFYLRPSYMLKTLFRTNTLLKFKVLLIGGISIVPIIISSILKKGKK